MPGAGHIDNVTLGELTSVRDQKAFEYFIKHRKVDENLRNINNQKEFSKVLGLIYDKVSEYGIEHEGGVIAPRFFYFLPHRYPSYSNKLNFGKSAPSFLFDTGRRVYTLMFDLLFKDTVDEICWDMRKSFNKRLKEAFRDFIEEYKPSYKYMFFKLHKGK